MSASDRETQMQMRERALLAALRGRSLSVLHQDAAGRIDFAENLPAGWFDGEVVGRQLSEVLVEPLASRFAEALADLRNGGPDQLVEFHLPDEHARPAFEARFIPDGDGVTIVVADVTHERGREAVLASLLREVSHRSKNLLAIVQSVAMQTAHHSGGIQDFLDKFRGRLHALSSTQDLVTESNWRGTRLHSLVASQLVRLGNPVLSKLKTTGPNPLLTPNAALHIGLAMHELAANAVTHGALSAGRSGTVQVDAEFQPSEHEGPALVITWRETGIDGAAPQRPRFGTLVLERIVPLSVGGSAEFAIDGTSLRYRLVVPADQFED